MSEAPRLGKQTKDQQFLGRRDAFHVPGILVKSKLAVSAGAPVQFIDKSLTEVIPANAYDGKMHGIADPFGGYAAPGSLFWVLPSEPSVSGLRHHFDVNIDIGDMTEEYLSERVANEERWQEQEDYADQCRGCY